MIKTLEDLKQRITVNLEGKPCYDIVFSNDFSILKSELLKFDIDNKKICIVTETNVGPLYAKKLKEIISPLCSKVVIHQFEAGEENKHLGTVEGIYETLITNKFDRNDMLIALGGGVTGDITGFVAATYLRGIDFIQIPTTLLSQVDSSIGGKTGVDFKSYKNMVGAFYMPRLVYINISTLNSLPDREYLEGMGEIIKHGLIKDKEYFYWLQNNKNEIINRQYDTLMKMIFASCNIKREVVENDPKEKGERALLNFGHTIGHAVEKLKDFKLLHGECVAIGMSAAAFISAQKGYLTDKEYKNINKVINDFGLPFFTTDIDASVVVETTKNDKKMDSGVIKFVLIEGIGKGIIDKTLNEDMLLDGIKSIVK